MIYGSGGLYAIEVRNSASIRPQDLRGLRSFGEDYPESMRVLLYRGEERLVKEGILCMSCDEFLRGLRPGEFPE